jgi:hypothetical protein
LSRRGKKLKKSIRILNRGRNRRLGFIQLQQHNIEETIEEIEGDLHTFTEEFDVDMEHQANRAGFEMIKNRFDEVKTEQQRKNYFLRNSKFEPPKFDTVATDVEDIMDFGRVVDQSEFSQPLIIMNTYNFELLEYKQTIKTFEHVPVKGINAR